MRVDRCGERSRPDMFECLQRVRQTRTRLELFNLAAVPVKALNIFSTT
jgi:hypothetical protein